MAGLSRGGSTPFAWTAVFYLLLVFVAPLAFLHTASAQDEQAPIREDLGDGTFHLHLPKGRLSRILMIYDQSSVSISELPIRTILVLPIQVL